MLAVSTDQVADILHSSDKGIIPPCFDSGYRESN